MIVSELIAKLQELPQDAVVKVQSDYYASNVDHVGVSERFEFPPGVGGVNDSFDGVIIEGH